MNVTQLVNNECEIQESIISSPPVNVVDIGNKSFNLISLLVSDIEPFLNEIEKILGRSIPKINRRSKIQQLNDRMRLYLNQQILEAEDGVYTYIIVQVNQQYMVLFSRATDTMEYFSKHNNMLYLAYHRGILPKTIRVTVAGELLKYKNSFNINFMSGTYSQITKEYFSTDNSSIESSIWFPMFIQAFMEIGFHIHSVSHKDKVMMDNVISNNQQISINYINRILISKEFIPFDKDVYLQSEYLSGTQFIVVPSMYVKSIKSYLQKLVTYHYSLNTHALLNERLKKMIPPPESPPIPDEFRHIQFLSEI
jgi:hypothetical protein